jgi:hypothetical protein
MGPSSATVAKQMRCCLSARLRSVCRVATGLQTLMFMSTERNGCCAVGETADRRIRAEEAFIVVQLTRANRNDSEASAQHWLARCDETHL